MLVDIYCHIYPQRYVAAMEELSAVSGGISKRLRAVKPLVDLDARFIEMDRHGDYRQIVSLPNPPIEDFADAGTGLRLSRLANDSLAELCAAHPDRFPGFVAALCLLDPETAAAEAERAFSELGARGVQIYTNVAGEPLDQSKYLPIFELAARHDLPVWLHPARTPALTDYAAEPVSRYEMWWCFGWPYETSVAVSRLIFSGLFDRLPRLKLITHHLGGMIPFYDGRIGVGMEVLGSRTVNEDYSGVLRNLQRPHMEYFHLLFADTAMFGAGNGLRCGIDFFGVDNVVFATDTPLGPIAPTIQAIESLGLSAGDKDKIMFGNAGRLLNIIFD